MLRRIGLGIASTGLVLAMLWWMVGGTAGLVGIALPEFPELPAPMEQLAEGQSGAVYFASATPFDFDVLIGDMSVALPTTGIGTLFLPEGASTESPVPAMVVVHGSGGIQPGREMEYGALLAENGYAALVIDYYTPRGATDDVSYMIRVLSVTEFDAVTDAYNGLRLLQTHPAIDPGRIGVMGFSYGGMATRIAMDQRVADSLLGGNPPFAAHIDYYGPCFQNFRSPAATGAPLLTLRGTEDASNELPACRRREAELRELGASVEAHVYEGVGHSWEALRPRAMSESSPYVSGCEMDYDEQGRPMTAGQYIVNVPVETSREERIALRMASGDLLADCVKSGYIIGRDDAAKARSDAHMLEFLGRTL
jgi:dienelactone hydrolase